MSLERQIEMKNDNLKKHEMKVNGILIEVLGGYVKDTYYARFCFHKFHGMLLRHEFWTVKCTLEANITGIFNQ